MGAWPKYNRLQNHGPAIYHSARHIANLETAEMIINCPHCSGQMTVTAQTAGQNLTCPHCAKVLTAPAAPAPTAAPMARIIKPGESSRETPVQPPSQRPPNPAAFAPAPTASIPTQAPAGPVGTPLGSSPGAMPPPRAAVPVAAAQPAARSPQVVTHTAGGEHAEDDGPAPSQAVMRARSIKQKSSLNTILLIVGLVVGIPLLGCAGVGAYFITVVDSVYDAAVEVQSQRDEAAEDYARQALGNYGYKELTDTVVSDVGTMVQVRGQALKGGWQPFICTFNVSQTTDGLSWDLENVTVSGKQLYQRGEGKK